MFHQGLNLSDTALPVSGCSQAWLYSVGAQLSDMPLLMPCPLQGAEKQQLCDFTRRRRWLRRRRESLAGSAPPTPSSARPAPSAQLQGNSSRRTTSLRCDTLESSENRAACMQFCTDAALWQARAWDQDCSAFCPNVFCLPTASAQADGRDPTLLMEACSELATRPRHVGRLLQVNGCCCCTAASWQTHRAGHRAAGRVTVCALRLAQRRQAAAGKWCAMPLVQRCPTWLRVCCRPMLGSSHAAWHVKCLRLQATCPLLPAGQILLAICTSDCGLSLLIL